MSIKETTRNLRKNQTNAEKLLWECIRNRKHVGKKFLRQYPLSFFFNGKKRLFIADFYCSEHRLLIELDGEIHKKQKEYDVLREWIIEKLGYKIIRFQNNEIEQNIEGVLNKISEHCTH